MSGYLLSIIGAVLITGMISAILPEGKTSGAVKAVAKLFCLLVILTPVAEYLLKGGEDKKIFSDFSEQAVIQTDESFIDYCSRKRIEAAEEEIVKEAEEEFSLLLTAEIRYEREEDGKIKILCIVLSDVSEQADEAMRKKLAEELRAKYGAEVEFQ